MEVNYNRNRDSVWIPRGSPRHSRNHSTIEPSSPSVMMTQLGNSLVPLEQLRVNPSTPSYAQLIKNSNSDENVERLTWIKKVILHLRKFCLSICQNDAGDKTWKNTCQQILIVCIKTTEKYLPRKIVSLTFRGHNLQINFQDFLLQRRPAFCSTLIVLKFL